MSRGLYPAALGERGLAAALEELADRAALPADLDLSAHSRLPADIEAAAYFVASEALTNTIKHAHASQVRIAARCERTLLVVEIGDDGIGTADPESGSGLRGLADRVRALGGRLVVYSKPGRGTLIRAELPYAYPAPPRRTPSGGFVPKGAEVLREDEIESVPGRGR